MRYVTHVKRSMLRHCKKMAGEERKRRDRSRLRVNVP